MSEGVAVGIAILTLAFAGAWGIAATINHFWPLD